MKNSYINPWHKPGHAEYGPKMYENGAPLVVTHRGVSVFKIRDNEFHYVFHGMCLTIRAGGSAKRSPEIINKLFSSKDPAVYIWHDAVIAHVKKHLKGFKEPCWHEPRTKSVRKRAAR